MVTLQKIDEVAIRWNKTRDPKDKVRDNFIGKRA